MGRRGHLVGRASYTALSEYVTFGPRVWLPGFMAVLLIPLLIAYARGYYRLACGIGFVLLFVTTVSVIIRVFFLVATLSGRGASALSVLVDSVLIWVSTVVTFAVWYWEIDGGGPAECRLDAHVSEGSLFPQLAFKAREFWPDIKPPAKLPLPLPS